MWFFLVYNSPADHPRISAEERQFIETALNKKAGGKVVILGVLTHTHPHLTALCPGTTQVSRYQKGKTNLDFTEARDSEWQWHQLGHMQVCTSLQRDNRASTPPLKFFTGPMPFLPPNQQRQSTESTRGTKYKLIKHHCCYDLRKFNFTNRVIPIGYGIVSQTM